MSSQDEVLHHPDKVTKTAIGAIVRVMNRYGPLKIEDGRKSPPEFVRVKMGRPQDMSTSTVSQEAILSGALDLLVDREVLVISTDDDGVQAYHFGPKAPQPETTPEPEAPRRRSRARRPGRTRQQPAYARG